MEILAAVLAVALPALGSSIGQGWVASRTVDSIWRQPEAANDLRITMIIGLAFLEALVLFGLAVSFTILFTK